MTIPDTGLPAAAGTLYSVFDATPDIKMRVMSIQAFGELINDHGRRQHAMEELERHVQPNWSNDMPWADEMIIAYDQWRAMAEDAFARYKGLAAAIHEALADDESGAGWGPDVTVCARLKAALIVAEDPTQRILRHYELSELKATYLKKFAQVLISHRPETG